MVSSQEHKQAAQTHWPPGLSYQAAVIAGVEAKGRSVPPPPDMDKNAQQLPGTVQDLRPDASILREGTDPATGDRYIEDLSFEVVNKQSMADLRLKAKRLRARGVRRVFAILVNKGQVVEWSAAASEFVPVGLQRSAERSWRAQTPSS
jgi:hypothetical protein